MRRVIYGGACSLDLFLATPDHGVDWLMWDDEIGAYIAEFWKTVDAIVMGRKTFEVAQASGQGGGASPGLETYVCSRTLRDVPEGVTLVSDDAGEFVRSLKAKDGKDICIMGGGDLARSLFEADVIDEVGFNIHPILLGAGIPAIHPLSRPIKLETIESRPFRNGCLLARYRVKR